MLVARESIFPLAHSLFIVKSSCILIHEKHHSISVSHTYSLKPAAPTNVYTPMDFPEDKILA